MADPIRGQVVVAVVQLREGVPTSLTTQDLVARCRDRLEAYKIPKRVWLCEAWPFTASGKTDHAALAEALRAVNTPNTKDSSCLCLLS